MALDLSGLKADIFEALKSMIPDDLPEDSRDDTVKVMESVASQIAGAVDKYVKTGTINTTTKGATSSGTATSGTGTGKIT